MSTHYPVVLIPTPIQHASTKFPDVLPVYPAIPPLEPSPKPPSISRRKVASSSAIAAIPAAATASTPEFRPYGVGVTVMAFIAIALTTIKRRVNIKAYGQKVYQWHQETQLYQEKKRQFEADAIAAFQLKLILACLRQTIPPDGHNSRAKQGLSEAKFAQVLESTFPGKIQTRRTLTIPGYRYPYMPDFVYWDEETRLHIDIEIDEPYDWRSHEPLHFIGCRKERRRNQFFLNKGWLVIRFSEEQVVRWPEQCCHTVSEAIAQTLGDELVDSLGEVLPIIPRWTREEAIVMAMSASREKYEKSA